MGVQQTNDATKQNNAFQRTESSFRPLPGVVLAIGMVVKLLSQDQQVWTDAQTIGLPSTGTGQQLLIGVVSDAWPGFYPNQNTFNGTAPSATARGTFNVDLITAGYHPSLLVDQSGSGATTITNETPLVPSRTTAGYSQGVATAVGGLGTVAVAMLPASGIGSSITAGALTQASQTVTLSGSPSAGDIITVTLQVPYSTVYPGVVQTRSVATTLSSAQATSVTTAAAAVVAAIAADSVASLYYTASNAAGVITIKSIGGSTPFLVTFAGTYGGIGITQNQFSLAFTGSAANGATIAAVTTSGTTVTTAGGSSLSGGAGYFGPMPAWVC